MAPLARPASAPTLVKGPTSSPSIGLRPPGVTAAGRLSSVSRQRQRTPTDDGPNSVSRQRQRTPADDAPNSLFLTTKSPSWSLPIDAAAPVTGPSDVCRTSATAIWRQAARVSSSAKRGNPLAGGGNPVVAKSADVRPSSALSLLDNPPRNQSLSAKPISEPTSPLSLSDNSWSPPGSAGSGHTTSAGRYGNQSKGSKKIRDLFNQPELNPPKGVPLMIRHLQPSATQNGAQSSLTHEEEQLLHCAEESSVEEKSVDEYPRSGGVALYSLEEKALVVPPEMSLPKEFERESDPLVVAQRLRDILRGVGKGQRVAPAGQVCRSFLRDWSQPLRQKDLSHPGVFTEAEEASTAASTELEVSLEPVNDEETSLVCSSVSLHDREEGKCAPDSSLTRRPLPCSTRARPVVRRANSSPNLKPQASYPSHSSDHSSFRRSAEPKISSFATRREALMQSLHELRRVGRMPTGPVEELLAPQPSEDGETLLARILEDTCDGPECLRITIKKLEASMGVAASDGAARHPSICFAERALRAAKRKYQLLTQLAAARASFARNKNSNSSAVLELKQILGRVLHHEVPTRPEDNLHPRHRLAQQARFEIKEELERKARRALEVARATDSCDAIEQKIVCATFVGVPKSHPALVEAKKIADSLREAERLKQRRAFAEARQEKLREEQVKSK